MVDLGVGLLLLAVLGGVFGVAPSPALLLLPIWLLLLLLTALGPIMLLAALNVRYRDVRYVIPPALQALLLLSPVAYSSASVEGVSGFLYALNPAVGALEFGRFILVGTPWPGWQLGVSIGSMLTLAVLGFIYFQHAQRSFADYI
jgi:ABC-2 type transport system permease protein/lipopolysaccharide transport system permease protein